MVVLKSPTNRRPRMANISRTLRHIKQDLKPFLRDRDIKDACERAGYSWRERILGPVQTVHLFILQVLSFNTAITHLRLIGKKTVKAAAYCKARMRLPLAVLQDLLRSSSAAMRKQGTPGARLWHGLRTFLADGSSALTPDVPELQKAFGQHKSQKPGCGFPMPKILGLFDAFSGLIAEMLNYPLRTHEMSKVWLLHPLLAARDLLVGDRGFCSYAHLALLHARGVFGLFRMHQNQIVSFRPGRKAHGGKASGKGKPRSTWIKRLGKHDQLVKWSKPKNRPKWMTAEQYESLPDSLPMREIRYRLPRKGQRTLCVTIATTLLDAELYPKEEIAALYNVRWTVETHFGELKTTLKMRKLKSRTPDGIRKELTVYCLVYNLVHWVMLQAAERQKVSPDRISFIDTVRWLLSSEPGEDLPDLIVNPLRPNRHEPRVIKDRQDSYKIMNKPRAALRKELKKQAVTA
jgi:hypothetical protein